MGPSIRNRNQSRRSQSSYSKSPSCWSHSSISFLSKYFFFPPLLFTHPGNSKSGSPAVTPRKNSLTDPKKRNSFNLLLVNYILIFGGGDDRRLYNDLYALNTGKLSALFRLISGRYIAMDSLRGKRNSAISEVGPYCIFGG
jgi:hypothetical protein